MVLLGSHPMHHGNMKVWSTSDDSEDGLHGKRAAKQGRTVTAWSTCYQPGTCLASLE